jgi:hypothetical protein
MRDAGDAGASLLVTEPLTHGRQWKYAILGSRRIESDKPNMTKQYFEDKEIHEAAFVLERIGRLTRAILESSITFSVR